MPTEKGKGAMFRQRWRRLSAVAAGILMLTSFSATIPAQADSSVQSLTGETLVQPGPDLPNGVPVSRYDCNPTGTSTVTFTASGIASGPYPGTFTETGTVIFGPQAPFGRVTSFQANFTITSVNGTVTGTKTLQTNASTAVAFCNQVGGQIVADLNYTAQITTPSGTATDQGQSNTTQFNLCPDTSTCGTIGSGNAFTEWFVSQTLTPTTPTPVALVLTPAAATNPVGTQHCVTATATDASGNPVSGVKVRFAVTGSATTSGSGTTDANGQTTFCYNGPELPGSDAITAYADVNNDSTQNATEPSGAATKVWALSVSTPLCQVSITNGGRITANDGDKATFGGNAQVSKNGQPKGSQTYQDHGPVKPMTVKSTTVLAVVCSPDQKQATIYGKATINGTGSYLFKIDVRDIAEPGIGKDTYRILLSNGYDSGEHPLEGGNIQIRIG